MGGAYNTPLKLADYSTTRLFNILLVTPTIKIIFLAAAFILTIKILNRKNQEINQTNISKLILITVLLELIFGATFSYIHLNSIQLPNTYHTPIYVYLIVISLLNYIFLNIIYSVFFQKKYIKMFTTVILILMVGYIVNITIYKINFNHNYSKANIQNNFYLYPQTNIKKVIGDNTNKYKNSAKKTIELINSLSSREQLQDTENKSLSYIYPTENDLELLRQINQAEYLNISEKYIPDDIILCHDCMVVPLNNLRAFSRGVIKLVDNQLSQDKKTLATKNFNQLLLFGDQLIRDKDDGIIVKLVGISIAKLSAEKLSKLNPDNEDLKNYLIELEEIKNNFSQLTKLELNVSDEVFGSKESATYFKFYDKYRNIIYPDPIIKYTFYNMDVPIIWPSLSYVGFLEESGPGIGESLVSMAGGVLIKANVGKNYTFYNKVLEIQKYNNDRALDYYTNHDTLSIIRKHSSEMSRIFEIRNEIILK